MKSVTYVTVMKNKSNKKREHVFSVTIKDCDVQTFCSGGPGGQHQNKTESGVRVRHRESGAVGESRDSRSQHANKATAFKRMAESKEFKMWINRRVFEIKDKKTIEETVEEMMQPENLKIEVKKDGKWTVLDKKEEDSE